MRHLCILSILLALSFGSYAQKKGGFGGGKVSKTGKKPSIKKGKKNDYFPSNPKKPKYNYRWGDLKWEYNVALGAANYLGDLGGQDGPGGRGLEDIEWNETNLALGFGARKFFKYRHAYRINLMYGRISGSDENTAYINRKYRNLSFTSNIIETSGFYEFHLLRSNFIHKSGMSTGLKRKGNRFGLYGFAGAGLIWFNPKAELNGTKHALKPLSTEGQGLPGGSDPYRRIQPILTAGGGLSFQLNSYFKLFVEAGYRKTFTDYLDDVGGLYYDNNALRAAKGDVAADLANRNNNEEFADFYVTGGIRGGEGNDNYMMAHVGITGRWGDWSWMRKRPNNKKKTVMRPNFKNPKLKQKKNRGRIKGNRGRVKQKKRKSMFRKTRF